MKKIRLLLLICLGLMCTNLYSKDRENVQRTQSRSVESFPYPFARMHYVQPRFDRTNYKDGTYLNSYVLRAFSTFWKDWHFRVEVPLADSNISGKHVFGLSDINFRAVYAHHLHDKLYWVNGLELVANTATDNSLGSGKWDLRPGSGLLWFRGTAKKVTGSMVLSAEYRTSLAKEGGVTRTNMLGFIPNIDWWFSWGYFGYYATWTYDFNTKTLDIPIDVEAGCSILPNFILAVEFVYPLVSKVTYRNEFAVKLRYSF